LILARSFPRDRQFPRRSKCDRPALSSRLPRFLASGACGQNCRTSRSSCWLLSACRLSSASPCRGRRSTLSRSQLRAPGSRSCSLSLYDGISFHETTDYLSAAGGIDSVHIDIMLARARKDNMGELKIYLRSEEGSEGCASRWSRSTSRSSAVGLRSYRSKMSFTASSERLKMPFKSCSDFRAAWFAVCRLSRHEPA
jgi:hypothetical protein